MNMHWGLCRECKWWQIHAKAPATNATIGECVQVELQQFVLRVSGGSGCNRFLPVHQGGKEVNIHDPRHPRMD